MKGKFYQKWRCTLIKTKIVKNNNHNDNYYNNNSNVDDNLCINKIIRGEI